MTEIETQTAESIAKMIDLETESPAEMFRQIHACLRMLNRDALVHFVAGPEGADITASLQGEGEIPSRLAAAICKVTPSLIRCEIEAWHDTHRSSGRLFIGQNDGVFLDAEDIQDDWDYQRFVDLDNLEEAAFDPDEDKAVPQPA